MGWFSSNKNSETDYDSIITTTGDLKEEYSIMGIIFSDGSLGDSTQDWEVELIKLKTKALAMKGHAIIYVKAISDGKYSRLMGTVVHDMYPQYWTTGIGGIFMKYSYEYKRNCVELYRQGKWPETPEGTKVKRFHDMVRIWVRIEDACGPEALQHQNQNKLWTAEEKYELVAKILAGASVTPTAIAAGINKGLLYQWVRCYRMKGYQGLVARRKGRPPKEPDMKNKIEPAELTPSEREEIIRLRAENERLRAEIAIVKKRIALREERFAAQLKAKKLHSSKNCVTKGIS